MFCTGERCGGCANGYYVLLRRGVLLKDNALALSAWGCSDTGAPLPFTQPLSAVVPYFPCTQGNVLMEVGI